MSGKTRQSKPTTLVFYSVPAATIAQVCGVSINTARSYKNGNRRPSKSVVMLMQLWKDGRILGPEFKGFRVHKGTIADPEGNVTTANQLRGYGTLMQLVREWARSDPHKHGQVEDALVIMAGGKRA